MTNELTNLQQTKTDLMKGLHLVYGFNFEQPYRVAKVCGSTTVRALEKSVCADKNDKVVALVKDGQCYKAVVLTPYASQGFDIEKPRAIHCARGISWWKAFDTYCFKRSFSDARANCDAEIIVVAQDVKFFFNHTDTEKYASRVANRTNSASKSVDVRYKLIEVEEHTYGTDLVFTSDGNHIHYATARPKDNETVTDVLDKSGYYVRAYREALKKRANERRAEIKRAEVQRTDFSSKITTLREVIKARRELLANELHNATTAKDLEAVRDSLSFWGGLLDIVRDFEEFEQNAKDKSFASVEASEALYNRILKKAMESK